MFINDHIAVYETREIKTKETIAYSVTRLTNILLVNDVTTSVGVESLLCIIVCKSFHNGQ